MNMLQIKSIDVMKLSKDTITNQQTQQQIQSAVAACKSANATHIAISIPLNSNAEMIANNSTPKPLTIEQYTQAWTDAIHSAGLRVIFRGTFCECEGIYNFPFHQDTTQYWLEKIQLYITNNPTFFASGDIFAPFPESTNVISGHQFGDIFLAMPNGTQDYANFFIQLHKTASDAFINIHKAVQTGFSTNNYTEIASGWIPQSLFDDAKVIAVDDYGNPSQIDTHLRAIASQHNKYPIFHQEWGLTYTPGNPTTEFQTFLDGTQKRVTDGIQNGLNYWGGWTGTPEAIFTIDAQGQYQLNGLGKQLQAFYQPPIVIPNPPITTNPIPAFSLSGQIKIVSDGKGNVTISLTNATN